jgi:hypothetical protein
MSVGEKAWDNYQEIGKVLESRYQLSKKHIPLNPISLALQRLGEAILLHYKLDPKTHLMERIWTMSVSVNSDTELKTIEQMLKAKIVEWEDAIPFEKVGHDVWVGRDAGWRAQSSLESLITENSLEIKMLVEATPEKMEDMLTRLETIVNVELGRLGDDNDSTEKVDEINNALTLLHQAVQYKYRIKSNKITLSERIKAKIDTMDIYSYTTMLDAEIKGRSLRQALNLSSKSWLRSLFGLHEALWGQTTALENVEKALFSQN